MFRPVPLWALMLTILVGLVGAVMLGWGVKSALGGSRHALAVAAYGFASFPDLVTEAVDELSAHLSGDLADRAFRVDNGGVADLDGFIPVKAAPGIALKGLYIKAEAGAPPAGWRVLSGAFHVNGTAQNAILLLSPELEVVRVSVLRELAVDNRKPAPENAKIVHGFEILPDGSFIFSYNGSVSLQRWNSCGVRLWGVPGWYHHAVTATDDRRSVWTFNEMMHIARVAIADGRIEREITTEQIIAANPDIHLLELRRLLANEPNKNLRHNRGEWLPDPIHYNDVEPLPAAMEDIFPAFEAGDLLVSARSLDLVFVLDPQSLRIKWWHIGWLRRQHDPDWLPSGDISVFNNRMGLGHSDIVRIDPETNSFSIAHDGRANDFYTYIRGKHQWLPDGGLVVTSSQQGRVFEIDSDGRTTLELRNVQPGGTDAYVVTEMKWLPTDYFNDEDWKCDLSSAAS